MSRAAFENIQCGERLRAGVKGGIDDGIEAARPQRLFKIGLTAAIAIKTFDARRQDTGGDTPVEYRNRMRTLRECLDDGKTKIAGAANDQYVNDSLLMPSKDKILNLKFQI